MKKILTAIMKYFQKNPDEVFFLLCIAFIGAGAFSGGSRWLMIPSVRLVLHAVAAFFLVQFFNMLGLIIILIARELIGIWVAVIGQMKLIRKKTVLQLRSIVKLFMLIICPFIGTGAYIAKSYVWESQQAIEYARGIQMDQLLIDIIFSIIGCIFWIRFFNRWAKISYFLSPSEGILHVKNILEEEKRIEIFDNEKLDKRTNFFIQMVTISIILLIPIWVTIIMVLAIKYLGFIPCWGVTA